MRDKEILNIEFGYGTKPNEQQLARLRELSDKDVILDENGSLSWSSQDYKMTLDEALSFGFDFKVTSRTNFCRIKDIEEFEPRLNAPAPINNKCNIVVAGTSLIEINITALLQDCCTDNLQAHLNEGWRILAICVQPDQRRPDYIVGKISK